MDGDALYLVVVGSSLPPRALPETGSLVIGSSKELAQLVLDAPGVDSAHCAIGRLKEGGFALKDLGSKSGVELNGQRVGAARLKRGDRIRIGGALLEVGSGAAPQVPGMKMQRRLGRGAMGEVWLAEQERLQRPVALKFLSPALARDAQFVQRFESEARAAAALNHPNVVVVYDVGTVPAAADSDALHYLSMEYMDGGSVEELAQRRGRLPWREVLPIFRDAARALEFARSRQLVHRDVKPANLMFGSGGHVKLADLGLAASTHPEALASEGGGERRIFGTPHFIAPEQARGEAPDHRSDLYSLGATVWRLLAGRTPFQGASTRDILRAAFTEPPPPLAAQAPDCPAALAQLVERLLAKDARERPQTAADVLAALEAVERAPAVATRGATTAAPRRASWYIGFALACALGIGGWYALRGRGEPAPGAGERTSGTRATGGSSSAGPALDAPSLEPAAPPRVLSSEDARVRELEAQLALRDAPPASDPRARLDALRALARTYAGSAAAANAENESAELERALARLQDTDRAAADAHERAVARFGERAGVDADAAPLDAVARALAELRGPAMEIDIAADTALAPLREEREKVLWTALAARAEAALQAGEAARARGEHARLTELVGALAALPELPPAHGRDGAAARAQVEAARARAAEWLSASGADAERYTAELASTEGRRLAAALRTPSSEGKSVAQQWLAFEFGAARARLDPLASSAHAPTRARVAVLAAELDAAQRALGALAASFAAGEWKRKTITDPRPGRGGVREVLGVDAAGVRVPRDGGDETIPWAAFAVKHDSLAPLFSGRRAREWDEAERDAIAALARLCVLAEVAPRLQSALRSVDTRPFGPSDAAALTSALDAVAELHASPAARERLDAERDAAARIARALVALGERRPAEAAAELERVLAAPQPTWVALLLSSGER
ncbi:MAG: FHA domain-containing protein [Planctomycetota bacterium]|nr:MAG: FHA domain-containing protein [Planctomycetota bacterium]